MIFQHFRFEIKILKISNLLFELKYVQIYKKADKPFATAECRLAKRAARHQGTGNSGNEISSEADFSFQSKFPFLIDFKLYAYKT